MFFRDAHRYSAGMADYESFIHGSTLNVTTGIRNFAIDASSFYVTEPDSIARMVTAYPSLDLKIIILLREPVMRLYSEFRFCMTMPGRCGVRDDDFVTYVTKGLDDYDACTARNSGRCGRPQLFRAGLFDGYIDAYKRGRPDHFFCLINNVGR